MTAGRVVVALLLIPGAAGLFYLFSGSDEVVVTSEGPAEVISYEMLADRKETELENPLPDNSGDPGSGETTNEMLKSTTKERLEALGAWIDSSDVSGIKAALEAFLAELKPGELPATFDIVRDLPASRLRQEAVLAVLGRWTEYDPESAYRATSVTDSAVERRSMESVVWSEVLASDPERVFAWMDQGRTPLNWSMICNKVAAEWISGDAGALRELFLRPELPHSARVGMIEVITAPSEADGGAHFTLARELFLSLDSTRQVDLAREIGSSLATSDLDLALNLISEVDDFDVQYALGESLLSVWVESEPERAFEYINQFDSDRGGDLIVHAYGTLVYQHPDMAIAYLSQFPESSLRDEIMIKNADTIGYAAKEEDVLHLIDSVGSGGVRDELVEGYVRAELARFSSSLGEELPASARFDDLMAVAKKSNSDVDQRNLLVSGYYSWLRSGNSIQEWEQRVRADPRISAEERSNLLEVWSDPSLLE